MKGWVCCAISGPVSVQITPATASAAEVSMLTMLCVGVWRADKSQIEHFPQLDVVGKLAPSAQQAIVFLAGKRLAHPALFLVSFGQGQLPKVMRAPCRGSQLQPMLPADRRSISAHSSLPSGSSSPPATDARASEDLRLALPNHLGSSIRGSEVEAGDHRNVSARHTALPLILRALRDARPRSSSIFTSAIPLI